MTNPIPDDLADRFVPYLMIEGASEAIDFYVRAFGATERFRMPMPDGKIGHAELIINGAPLYLADAPDDMPGSAANPKRLGGTTVLLHQYVTDVDAVFARAVEAGATPIREPEDQFYGDRASVVEDPFGHQWSIHTHLRDMTPEDMERAMGEMGG